MMRTTLIGHATLLIQSKNTTLLTDPLFFERHWEEINVHCPAMELDKDKIPPVDILNLSHRHQDHFDVRTLAYIAKNKNILAPDAKILAPRDEILLKVLSELKFENVEVVQDFESLQIKDFTLTPTPSMNQQDYFPEHGLLVHDGEVTVWNQVDTIVIPKVIQYIHKLYGQVDFAHVRYLPLLEGSFTFHNHVELPMEEYSSFLKVAAVLRPKFAVPGSAGFRYADEYDFLNHYTFPTTQEQFLNDLNDFCPDIGTSTFFPGDVAEITPSGTQIHRQASDFVRVSENDGYRAEFKPIYEVPRIQTRTKDKAQQQEEIRVVQDFIENKMVDLLVENQNVQDWVEWKVAYQLEVFGENGSDIWTIDFAGEDAVIRKERLNRINLYEGISYSEFYNLLQKKTNWDYVGVAAQYRTFNNIYRVNNGEFESYTGKEKFPEPLQELFPAGEEMDLEKYMKDVRRWKENPGS
jgi:L-ascorbate metabolism protein UlaG (beta-lactamase superfamily)